MATDSTVKTWSYGQNGMVNITFQDGHTESMPSDQAITKKYIPDPGGLGASGATKSAVPTGKTTVAPSGASGPGSYGSSTAVTDPFGSGVIAGSNYTVPVNGQQIPIGTLLQKANDPKVLAQIGSALRQYGIISKGTRSQQSIISAYTSVLVKAAAVSMDPNKWMAEFKAAGGGVDTATPSGPQTNIQLRTYTPDTIRSVADQIYVNELGRRVTDADLAKLTAQLNAKEKAAPTKTVSVPNAAGTVTTSTTSGGVDESGFITQQARQMPEYQRMQNINFASWLDKAMTTGQPSIGSLTNG